MFKLSFSCISIEQQYTCILDSGVYDDVFSDV
jgi:hypothetical protein